MRSRKKSVGAQTRPEQLAALHVPQRIGRWVIPSTVPEVLRVIGQLFWHQVITPAHTLAWSCFRRHHQAVAQACHYQRQAVTADNDVALGTQLAPVGRVLACHVAASQSWHARTVERRPLPVDLT